VSSALCEVSPLDGVVLSELNKEVTPSLLELVVEFENREASVLFTTVCAFNLAAALQRAQLPFLGLTI
jgi:hypothetical protein